jgi:hypothetical protein
MNTVTLYIDNQPWASYRSASQSPGEIPIDLLQAIAGSTYVSRCYPLYPRRTRLGSTVELSAEVELTPGSSVGGRITYTGQTPVKVMWIMTHTVSETVLSQ